MNLHDMIRRSAEEHREMPTNLSLDEQRRLITQGQWCEWNGRRIVAHPDFAPHSASRISVNGSESIVLNELHPTPPAGTPLLWIENPYS
ncbi:MAG: hypothetical protein ACR2P3_00300 [Geminicoccaceae bacterium]